MKSVLDEIEELDVGILGMEASEADSMELLLDRRTKLACRLLPSLKGAGSLELVRVAAILNNTTQIEQQVTKLRVLAAEELNLLERQDQLLHLLQPVIQEPTYMDFSA